MSAPMTPKAAWGVNHALQMSLVDGKSGLDAVPKLLTRIIRDELWRSFYCEPVLAEVEHNSFEHYVTDCLPTGLGTTIQMLKNMCRDDTEALDAIDRATQRKPGNESGANQYVKDEGGIFNNIQDSRAPTGTSRDAALRRLRKDRADLHEKVLRGEISAHAAMLDAGFRKKPSQAEICVKAFRKAENRLEALQLIWAQLEPHEIEWFQREIQEGTA
jgi:hypothetical protein